MGQVIFSKAIADIDGHLTQFFTIVAKSASNDIKGIVKSISVKENQVLKQGEAIATIDDSRLQTQKSQVEENT